MIFLIDHNLRGQAIILLGNLINRGWVELLSLRFVMFEEVGLSVNSSDRIVWQVAQANQMILLTANRSMKGNDSLEQVLREENNHNSLPVLTISSLARFDERDYRDRCVDRIVEIVLDIENYRGVGRLFIP